MSDQYRHQSGLCYTEGMHWCCEQGKCWWWLDLICSYQTYKRVKAEEFQVWRLVVDPIKRSAVATMTNGNDEKPIVTQKIEYTDFEKDELESWVVLTPGVGGTVMQPCEY